MGFPSYITWMGPKQTDNCPHYTSRAEGHVRQTEENIQTQNGGCEDRDKHWVRWPQAEEAGNHQKPREARDRISPRASVGRAALLTPWYHTSGLYNCEIANFYCVKPPSLLVSQQARDTYTAGIKPFLGFSSLLHNPKYFQTVRGLNIPPYIKDQGTRLPSLAVPKYFPHGHFPLQNVCSFLFISQCSQVMHQMLGSSNDLPASTMP